MIDYKSGAVNAHEPGHTRQKKSSERLLRSCQKNSEANLKSLPLMEDETI